MSYDPYHPGYTQDSTSGATNGATNGAPWATTGSPSEQSSSTGVAVGGFVCAITGGAVSFIPYIGILGLPVLIVGLVLCAIELSRKHLRRGLATAGLVVCLTALPLNATITIATLGSPASSSQSTEYSTASSGTGSSSAGYSTGGGSSSCPTSCNGTGSSSANSSYTGASGSSYSNADRAYLNALAHYGVEAGGDATAIGLGHAVCNYLSAGGTEAGAVQVITNQGASTYNAQIIVGAAEGAYCPTGT